MLNLIDIQLPSAQLGKWFILFNKLCCSTWQIVSDMLALLINHIQGTYLKWTVENTEGSQVWSLLCLNLQRLNEVNNEAEHFTMMDLCLLNLSVSVFQLIAFSQTFPQPHSVSEGLLASENGNVVSWNLMKIYWMITLNHHKCIDDEIG